LKILVVYYSFGGVTGSVAKDLAATLNADLMELKTDEKIDSSNFLSFSWDTGGERKFKLLGSDKDPADYDLIFVGTPVWAWAPAPPIYALFSDYGIRDKEVAFFATSDGDPGRYVKRLRSLVRDNDLLDHIEVMVPADGDLTEIRKEIRRWATGIVGFWK
jgi:flavodoxin